MSNSDESLEEFDLVGMFHILKQLHYCFHERTVGRPSGTTCYHLHFALEGSNAMSIIIITKATTTRVAVIHGSHLYPFGYTRVVSCLCWRDLDSG